ncbi:hypothetical protein RHS01_10720 [Rhizoctonia solani]|uniref:Uncharacterized protein n=1 Tax=Rhizoctonia solani TaxID=456999 RepID=A0A8H7I1H1_9AGAM|nr:hypothetical protein RHS01_10720 [Rhizoctonia solani]
MSSMDIDQATWEQFKAFLAMEVANKASKTHKDSGCVSKSARSPTIRRSLDHVKVTIEQDRYTGGNMSSTIGRTLESVESLPDKTLLSSCLPTPDPKENGPWSSENDPENMETPELSSTHSGTPHAFARQDQRKNCSKTALSSRSPSPPPANSTAHPYDACPTSYETRPGKRGGRVHTMIEGQQQIAQTPIERLVTRKAKYRYVLENGHLFGDKHGCYFNPYSKARVNKQNCKRIEKPQGFQVGRGGPGSKPWFELIGLRDDYDMALDVRGSACKALVLYCPQTLDLKPGQKLTYKNYGSQKQTQINNYMYKHHKFLYHFRDESGDDSWAIDAICAGYLASNSAYTRSGKNAKAALFLKRNASDPNSKGSDEDSDIGGEDRGRDKDESGEEDDYNLNARRYNNTQTASKPQPASRSLKRPHPSYGTTRPTKKARHLTRDEGDDEDDDEDDKDRPSSQPPTLPPKPTAANIRKANKATADPLGPGKGKGKECEGRPLIPRPKPIRRKEANMEDDDEDNEDNEPVRRISKSIRRVNSTLSSSDADPKPVRQSARQVPKSIRRVDSTPSSSDADPEPVAEPEKGTSSRTKDVKAAEKDMVKSRKNVLPPIEEDDERPKTIRRPKPKKTLQEPKEVSNDKGEGEREEPQSRKKRRLELAESRKQKTAKPLANGPKASSSNKVTTQSTGETAQELINTGKARAVGTLKIKLPVPPSDRSLRKRT